MELHKVWIGAVASTKQEWMNLHRILAFTFLSANSNTKESGLEDISSMCTARGEKILSCLYFLSRLEVNGCASSLLTCGEAQKQAHRYWPKVTTQQLPAGALDPWEVDSGGRISQTRENASEIERHLKHCLLFWAIPCFISVLFLHL